MSETTIEVPTAEWAEYEHRHTRVRAVRYDGHETSRRAIANEINRHQPEHAISTPGGDLLIYKPPYWIAVPPGHWVGIGWNGNLWEISDDVHQGCYKGPLAGPDFGAVLDRDTAAALVVAADHMVEECDSVGAETCREMIAALALWVHQLASSAEALR